MSESCYNMNSGDDKNEKARKYNLAFLIYKLLELNNFGICYLIIILSVFKFVPC